VQGGISHVSAFGQLLKDWRGRRGFSQLDLAVAARTTQRHLSFVESGRAKPSREMILRLAAAMSLSLRQQNALSWPPDMPRFGASETFPRRISPS